MSKYHVSRRLQFVIQFIYDLKYASKEHILDFLAEKDFNVSARTLERDFEKIKSDFGIELSYDKQQNGYYIDKDKSVKVASFFKFLELVTLTDVFSDGLKDNQKILDYVSFDDSSNLKGIENLKTILLAIKQERDLEFTHYNFHRESYDARIITPIMLKEYINRWYVIGVQKGENDIRSFGIERISNIELGEISKLDKTPFLKQTKRFEDIVGLYYSHEKPEQIVLKITDKRKKYLESLPLHHSQTITPCDEEGFWHANYLLIPNYEFIIEILKISIETEVLKPESFRNTIKHELKEIYSKYEDS